MKDVALFLVIVLLLQADVSLSQPSPLDRLKTNRGGEVVLGGIEAMGGWDTWMQKKNVEYEREVTRYEKDGRVIHEKQFYRFLLPPAVASRFELVSKGKRTVQGFDGKIGWILEDGKSLQEPERLRGARTGAFGTQYMFSVPFKLADPGTRFEYLGTTQRSGKQCDQVKVTYAPGVGDNPHHVWTFYFTRDTHFLERIDWTDHRSYSAMEFSRFRKVEGIWIPMHRSTYEADAQGNKKWKWSDLVYRRIRFNVPFQPSIFSPP